MFIDVVVHPTSHLLALNPSQHSSRYCILHESSPFVLHDMSLNEGECLDPLILLHLDPFQMRRLAHEALRSHMNLRRCLLGLPSIGPGVDPVDIAVF